MVSLAKFLPFTFGLIGSKIDSSLFNLKKNSTLRYVLIYVDILITGNVSDELKPLKSLSSDTSSKDIRFIKFLPVIKVVHHSTDLILSQQKYIVDLFQRTKMEGPKLIRTSLEIPKSSNS